jgi:flagellar L-ring protein precursor FlgH
MKRMNSTATLGAALFRMAGRTAALAAPLALAACMTDGVVAVREPTTAKPEAPLRAAAAEPRASSGSIFATDSYVPLFEDRRARRVGDTLVVNITENLSATRQSDTSSERSGSNSLSVPKVFGLPGKFVQGDTLQATSDNKFEGKGATSSANTFTGTMTVTVVEVLSNGNLAVSGEKQVGINKDSQTIRLSGVVSPALIMTGNTINSTQIADARIDYRGKGTIDEAQTMGWLARAFNLILPF